MKCPFCQFNDTRVVDSRLSAEGDNTRRRRECPKCQKRFTTYERVEELMPMVVKKDGRRESFDRVKILAGIRKACEKRSIPIGEMERLASEIEGAVREGEEKEIPASKIGAMVMEGLKKLDEVAYVRFASVYRSFRDVNEFLEEIQALVNK